MMNVIIKENVELKKNVTDWREAILIAGKKLEESGTINHKYSESMVEAVEEFGPYIVLAPGIAFAHSRPSKEVNDKGISLVTLKTPVCFGHPENDPVDIIVAIASKDQSSHIELLKKVVDFIDDEGNVHLLRNAETNADLDAIVKKINGG